MNDYIECPNSNLLFYGTKLDGNGNDCAVFGTPSGNKFLVQQVSMGMGSRGWNSGTKTTMDAETFLEKNPDITIEDLESGVVTFAKDANPYWANRVRLYKVFNSKKNKDMKNLTLEQERELVGKAYNIAVRKLKQIQSGIYTEDDLDGYTIEELKFLINQFPYGISAQKDLLYLCIELGWIKEDMVSDSRKIKDENTMDVLDGVLFIAFTDGTEDDMIAEVNKHANESDTIDGVQYETYETDNSDGVAMIDMCAATGDANAFVKALLNKWGIAENVADLEFEASDEMKEAVNDSRKQVRDNVDDDYEPPFAVYEDDMFAERFDTKKEAVGYAMHLDSKYEHETEIFVVDESGVVGDIVWSTKWFSDSRRVEDNKDDEVAEVVVSVIGGESMSNAEGRKYANEIKNAIEYKQFSQGGEWCESQDFEWMDRVGKAESVAVWGTVYGSSWNTIKSSVEEWVKSLGFDVDVELYDYVE